MELHAFLDLWSNKKTAYTFQFQIKHNGLGIMISNVLL